MRQVVRKNISVQQHLIKYVYIKQQQRRQLHRSYVRGPNGEREKQQHHGKRGDDCRVTVAEREAGFEVRFEMGLVSAANEPVASSNRPQQNEKYRKTLN